MGTPTDSFSAILRQHYSHQWVGSKLPEPEPVGLKPVVRVIIMLPHAEYSSEQLLATRKKLRHNCITEDFLQKALLK